MRTSSWSSRIALAEVAKRLGLKSRNAYARYEQGRSVPTIGKVSEFMSALGSDFVIRESEAG